MARKNAYSYIRFSSERQLNGNSLERQESLLQKYLSENPEYQLIEDSYKDLGVSGYTGKHRDAAGGLGQFLAACEAGRVASDSYLLVESIDRLSRLNGFDANQMIMDLLKHVSIITLEDGNTYTRESFNSHQIYVLQSKIQQAYSYSQQLSSRLKKARKSTRDKVRDGQLNKITKISPSWLKWSDVEDQFTIISSRVKVVIKIFEMYVLDGLGTTAIASKLNREKVPSFNGKGWYGSYIAKILFDRKVIGEMRGRSQEVLVDYYPQIVSTKLFLLAQEQRLTKSKAFRTRGQNNIQPFDIYSGVIFCECGQPAKLNNKGSNRYIYQCRNRSNGLCSLSDGLNKCDLVFHFGAYLDASLIRNVRKMKSDWVFDNGIENEADLTNTLKDNEDKLRRRLSIFMDELGDAIDELEIQDIKSKIEVTRNAISNVVLQLKDMQESELTNQLNQTFEMTDVGNCGVDWNNFISGDSRRITPNFRAINLNKAMIKQKIKIILHPNFESTLVANDLLIMTLSKPHRSSRAFTSRLKDGSLYIEMDENKAVTFGQSFEKPILTEFVDGKHRPIDPQIFVI